jgi:hypothetical protein
MNYWENNSIIIELRYYIFISILSIIELKQQMEEGTIDDDNVIFCIHDDMPFTND